MAYIQLSKLSGSYLSQEVWIYFISLTIADESSRLDIVGPSSSRNTSRWIIPDATLGLCDMQGAGTDMAAEGK